MALRSSQCNWGLSIDLAKISFIAKRLVCGQLAAAISTARRSKAAASRTHSKRFARELICGEPRWVSAGLPTRPHVRVRDLFFNTTSRVDELRDFPDDHARGQPDGRRQELIAKACDRNHALFPKRAVADLSDGLGGHH